jgi:serine/threonine protein kinase
MYIQMTEFVREGEMMRALRHPGIVKLLGVCVECGSFYLVQEIVNGYGNLFDYLHKPPVNRLTYWQVIAKRDLIHSQKRPNT